MKKSDKSTRKEHVVSTRISSEELRILATRSRRTNRSISDLMREALLHAIAPPKTGYPNS